MRSLALIVSACLAALPALAQQPMLPEDYFPQLQDMIAAAEANSPSLLAEAASVDESNANVDYADTMDDLKITSYARISGSYESRISSEQDEATYARLGPYALVQATYPIFHWGEYKARQEVAHLRARLARAAKENRAQQIAQEVRRYFLEFSMARQGEQIARDNIAFADRRVEVVQALINTGQAARRNLVEVEIFRLERQEDAINAEKTARLYLGMLRELTGRPDLQVESVVFGDLQMLGQDNLETLRSDAASTGVSPEQAQLQAALAMERAAFAELTARARPRIDIVANTSLDYVDEWRVVQPGPNAPPGTPARNKIEQVPRVFNYVGIQATWNIFDSGEIRALKLASKARQRRTEALLDGAQQRRQRSAEITALDVELNAQQIQTRTRKLELLENSVELLERQVSDGMAAENDLLERKVELERNRVELLRAKALYLLNIAELHMAANTPSE